MSLIHKALLVSSAQFVCLAIGTGQSAVLARALGPEGVGQYALLISSLMLMAQVASLGFPMSFLYHSKIDPEHTAAYQANTIWANLLTGSLGGLAMVGLIQWRPDYFGSLPWFALVGIAAYIPIVLQGVTARNSLMIQIEARRLSAMNIIAAAGPFLVILLLWQLGILGVGQAILCFASAGLVQAVVGLYWTAGRADFSLRPSRVLCMRLGRMGLRLSWADLMTLLNAQLSILLTRYLLGDFEQLGYFSRGLAIAMLLVTAGQAVFPLLFSRWADLPEEQLAAQVERGIRFGNTIGLVMIAAIVLTGRHVVLFLYGEQFLPAVEPLLVLLPGTMLYLSSRVLMQVLGSRGTPELAALALLVAGGVNVALSWWLIPTMGITGAALASTLANACLLCTMMAVVRRKHAVRVTRCLVMSKTDVWAMAQSLYNRNRRDVP